MSLPPATPRDSDEVAELRAEFAAQLAAQGAQIAALQASQRAAAARPRRQPSHRHPMRRFLPLALAALLVALVPLATLAANPFTDLGPGSVHNANIDAIYNAGVTTGCVPNAQYCPTDNVTRQEMASFLARIGGLGTNPPVANAKTVQGLAPTDLLRADFSAKTDPVGTALTTSFTSRREIGVTAPGAGYVLVTGHLGFLGQTGCPCTGVARLHDLSSTSAVSSANYQSVAATGQYGDVTVTWLFPVTAGARTFALEGQATLGTQINSFSPSLAAVFIPFGSSIATATETQAPGVPGQTP